NAEKADQRARLLEQDIEAIRNEHPNLEQAHGNAVADEAAAKRAVVEHEAQSGTPTSTNSEPTGSGLPQPPRIPKPNEPKPDAQSLSERLKPNWARGI